MKTLAILDLALDASVEAVRAQLNEEIRCSWALYAAGAIREAYATQLPTRVVFVLESDSVAAADGHLRQLPMVAAGLFRLEIVELRPFVNWSQLFAQNPSQQQLQPANDSIR